jgi:hypothetical protein
MTRSLLGACLLLAIGCQGIVGPCERLERPVRIDDPRLTIAEQEQKGREQLAVPLKSPAIAPRTYAEEPSYRGL